MAYTPPTAHQLTEEQHWHDGYDAGLNRGVLLAVVVGTLFLLAGFYDARAVPIGAGAIIGAVVACLAKLPDLKGRSPSARARQASRDRPPA